MVARQIREYLADHDLLPTVQSAYREHFSVETALLRVQNDILMAIDNRQEVVLMLLDFSAAFDTIDHRMLLERMKTYYGISGIVLKWFSSYLENRTHVVKINNTTSSIFSDKLGVPQGSVIGPLTFTMYTAPMADVIRSHGVNVMLYADDTQLYVMFNKSQCEDSLEVLRACISDVKIWAVNNKLSLNESKTEILHFTSKFRREQCLSNVNVGDSQIEPVPCARNLGVIFDQHMTMKDHAKSVCKSAMAGIRSIGKIRGFLSKKAALTLIHAFVTSRLDNCNSLLIGLPENDLHRLQMIQNTAARLVTRTSHHHSITQTLKKLQWLTVNKRIMFKILLITYKAQHGFSPSYIADLLEQYTPSRTLRSSNQALLSTPKTNTQFYGGRAFSAVAPSLWNRLPKSIKEAPTTATFKSLLKTHLFTSK